MSDGKKFGKGFLCGVFVTAAVTAAGLGVTRSITQHGTDEQGLAVVEENTQDGELHLDMDKIDSKIETIEAVINENYLNEVNEEKVEAQLYKGLVKGLEDSYAAYYTEEELQKIQESTSGEYRGIGAKLSQDPETGIVTVVTCFEDAPADRAGLLPGDIIYSVNDTEVTGMDLTDVVTLIKTAEGSAVHLEIVRDGEADYLGFDVERMDVSVPTVASKMLENHIGYIAISEFDAVTVDQFSEALAELEDQGMEKLIIDLRNNLGGLLQSCCEMLRQMLPEGLIVYTEDKYGQREEYTCDGTHEFTKPLVVLVNEYSASAAEIFSGAIKDHGIGTLVGTTTFGKGIVQRIVSLKDGTAVKLTISKYYTPKGTDIHQKGIEPDVTVELDESLKNKVTITEEEDNQLQKAIEILNAQNGE